LVSHFNRHDQIERLLTVAGSHVLNKW